MLSSLDRYILFTHKTCSKNNIILSYIENMIDDCLSNDLKKERVYVDLHIHSIYSDGMATPLEIARKAKARRLSAIGITDHLYIGKDQRFGISDRTFKSYFKACRLASQIIELCVVPGLELKVKEGHLVILFPNYNPPSSILKLKRSGSIFQICEKMHELGGLVLAAHIDRTDGMGKLVFKYFKQLDGIEYGLRIPEYCENVNFKELGLCETAGSDSHSISIISSAYTSISNDCDIRTGRESVERLLEWLRKKETEPHFLPVRRKAIALDHARWLCLTYLSKRVFQEGLKDKWLLGNKLNEASV